MANHLLVHTEMWCSFFALHFFSFALCAFALPNGYAVTHALPTSVSAAIANAATPTAAVHEPNEGKDWVVKKGAANIIINWCLMSHQKIYCSMSVRSKIAQNVNGHKSTSKMIAIRGLDGRSDTNTYTHTRMICEQRNKALATVKLILCMFHLCARSSFFVVRFFPPFLFSSVIFAPSFIHIVKVLFDCHHFC